MTKALTTTHCAGDTLGEALVHVLRQPARLIADIEVDKNSRLVLYYPLTSQIDSIFLLQVGRASTEHERAHQHPAATAATQAMTFGLDTQILLNNMYTDISCFKTPLALFTSQIRE